MAEDSLFAYAEAWDARRTTGLIGARPGVEPWLVASVAFSGPLEGAVTIALPRALCADLAGAFCGVRPQSLDDVQVADFAGELVNMVCGSWLTQTHRSERFALAAPTVAAAMAGEVAATAGDPGAVGLVLHDTPLVLVLAAVGAAARS